MSKKDKKGGSSSNTNDILIKILNLIQQQSQTQAQNDSDTITNVGNPVININLDQTDDGKKEKKPDCCECGAILEEEGVIVNICADCTNSGQNIIQFGDLTVTNISPPRCLKVAQGIMFTTGGLIGSNPDQIQGSVSLFLLKTPDGTGDLFGITISGVDSMGTLIPTSIVLTIPNSTLSIFQCNSEDCSCSSAPFTSTSTSFGNQINFDQTKGLKNKIMLNQSGEVEIID